MKVAEFEVFALTW